jgi:hypothetical protein
MLIGSFGGGHAYDHIVPVIQANTAISDGYNTVISAYNAIPNSEGIASAEAELKDYTEFDSDPFEGEGVIAKNEKAIINALFGNGESTPKTEFKTELDLYQAILYYEQKQRFCTDMFNDTTETLPLHPKRSTLESGISTLETAVKTKTGNNNYFDGYTTYAKKAAKLFLELTDKINAQMELDSNTSITPDDADKIKALNGALVTQLGDFAEFEAMVNDLKDIGYTINWANIPNAITYYPNLNIGHKSGLQFDSKSFDPNFLKQDLFLANGKKEEEQTALA